MKTHRQGHMIVSTKLEANEWEMHTSWAYSLKGTWKGSVSNKSVQRKHVTTTYQQWSPTRDMCGIISKTGKLSVALALYRLYRLYQLYDSRRSVTSRSVYGVYRV